MMIKEPLNGRKVMHTRQDQIPHYQSNIVFLSEEIYCPGRVLAHTNVQPSRLNI